MGASPTANISAATFALSKDKLGLRISAKPHQADLASEGARFSRSLRCEGPSFPLKSARQTDPCARSEKCLPIQEGSTWPPAERSAVPCKGQQNLPPGNTSPNAAFYAGGSRRGVRPARNCRGTSIQRQYAEGSARTDRLLREVRPLGAARCEGRPDSWPGDQNKGHARSYSCWSSSV